MKVLHIALPAIRLAFDFDNLKLQEYQLDATSDREEVASMLAEAIVQTVRLRGYLRRNQIESPFRS